MSDRPVLDEVLATLRANQAAVRENKFKVVGVFGSVARGEAGPDSDVDVVIEAIDPKANLLDMGGVWSVLNEALGRWVDIVELDALRPRFRAAVERDLVRL
jgi:hypothetical protein